MLKKSPFSPAQPRRAETRLFPCIVLVSLRGSTYRSVRLASSLTAALLDGPLEHPEPVLESAPYERFLRHFVYKSSFSGSLLGDQRGLGYLLVQTRVDAREVSSLALVGYARTRRADHLINTRRMHREEVHMNTILSRTAGLTTKKCGRQSCRRCGGYVSNEMCIDLDSDSGYSTFGLTAVFNVATWLTR